MTPQSHILAHLRSQPDPVVLATCETEQDLRRVYRRELRAWEQGGMDGDVVGIEMARAPPEPRDAQCPSLVGTGPAAPDKQMTFSFDAGDDK